MKRIEFLKKLGLGALSITSSSGVSGCMKHIMSPEPSASIIDGSFSIPLPALKYVSPNTSLEAQSVSVNILPNVKTNALGYHNNILGPTFEINSGEKVKIQFKNSHFDTTNLHWHGLIVPASQDGHPENSILPSQSKTFDFAINQRAAMCWYHPHPHQSTSEQTYKGLAGLFIVRDNEEKLLNLPSGEYEVPLVIQDKRIDADGSMNYLATMMDVMTGYLGSKIVVNGVYSPIKEVSSKIYRLRILNGSNARVYNLALSNDSEFTVIGSDGGLLGNVVKTKSLIVGPGERVDLLVDFTSYEVGSEIYLQSNSFAGSSSQGVTSFKIMKFKISKKEMENFKIPTKLSNYQRISEAVAIKTRQFDISNPHSSGSMMSNSHRINGKIFDMMRIDETVKSGTYEIWEFDNSKGDEIHPMHIHGALFQILDRTLRPLQANELGWKDTVLLMPKEKTRIVVQFPENKGKFLLHCHNLEHEDDGMMLNYDIV